MENKIYGIYRHFLEKYGPPVKFWPQWCAKRKSLPEREIIAIGAILTQRTSWHNAHLALVNLKKAKFLSLERIAAFENLKTLTELIRPAGFSRSKPRRLKDFSSFVIKSYRSLKNLIGEEQEVARKKLLSIPGIGPETADTLLLYVLDKPSFVVDEYTRRLVRGRKLTDRLDYDFLKDLFEKNLPKDVRVYQKFHALIIIEGKGELGSMMERI